MGRPAKDYTGQFVGYWEVLYKVGTQLIYGKNQPVWHCRCACGTERDLSSGLLGSGGSRSCGCKTAELQRRSTTTKNKRNIIYDLTDKKFNRLTVLERVERNKKGSWWKVRCDCGTEKVVEGSSLRSGTTKSCGCLVKEVAHLNSFKDETGKTFGRLTVISPVEVRGGEWYFRCLCVCGNETVVRGSHLRSGSVKSCMCLAQEMTTERQTTHGLTYTADYKRIQGRKRYWKEKYLDTEWDVQKEKLIRSFYGACVVCGKTEKEHLEEYQQILQVDHVYPISKGFGLKIGNAVVLCRECNHYKHNTMPEDLPELFRERIFLAADLFELFWNATT